MADYNKQIVYMLPGGVNLAVKRDQIPQGQYARLSNAIVAQDGSIQGTAGTALAMTAIAGAPVVHSLRRASDFVFGSTKAIVGAGTALYWFDLTYPAGGNAATVISTGTAFSGNPISITPAKLAFNSVVYAYIGDTTQNVKVNTSGAATRMGIPAPGQTTSVANGNTATSASGGAGNLNGDYDWRYTFYNSATGQEGNPSATAASQATYTNNSVNVTVITSDADAQVTHVRLYRRGGTLPGNWLRVSTTAKGASPQVIVDNATDTSLAAAATLELDNDVPVVSVNSAGATLYLQPIPYIWGPVNETLFAVGDAERATNKGRADTVYWTKKGRPESWPIANNVQVSSPLDKCMNGFVYGGKSFVFTRSNLYMMFPQDDGTWLPILTPCGRGIVGQWAFCVGPKIWFCSKDGIYETTGGESERISDDIRPLFPFRGIAGYAANAYNPVNFGGANADVLTIRMAYHNEEVWFIYQDSADNFGRIAVYSTQTKQWRFEESTPLFTAPYSDEIPQSRLLLMGRNGTIHTKEGSDWLGTAVSVGIETGGISLGDPRLVKEFGDVGIWANPAGGTITCTFRRDDSETDIVTLGSITGSGLVHTVFDMAGTYARTVAFRFSFDSTDASQPQIRWLELSYLPRAENIVARETDWDDLGSPTDKRVRGVIIEADPMGAAVTLQVQSEGGAVQKTITTPADATNFPREYIFTWSEFRAREVRLFPTSTTEWKLYRVKQWLFEVEPPTATAFETPWENMGEPTDKRIRGIILELDPMGSNPITIQVQSDGGAVQQTLTIDGTGLSGHPRKYHFTWTEFRSREVRLAFTSTGNVKLYRIEKWLFEAEPPTITTFETPWENLGTPHDKRVRGIHLELDPMGSNPITLQVQADGGAVQQTLTIVGTGLSGHPRKYQFTWTEFKAREVRLACTTAVNWKLYKIEKWLYEEEPATLTTVETPWDDLGYPADKWLTGMDIELDPMGSNPITILVQRDGGTTVATLTVNGTGITGHPRQYHFTWAGVAVEKVRLAATTTVNWKLYKIHKWMWTPMPEAVTRYDTDDTDYGFSGFHFERDAYAELISNGTLTLTITVDGTALATQTIATTGGAHRKTYIPFPPNKGKVYKYAIVLGTATAFQLYNFAVRAKQWNGESYQEVRPKFHGS